MIPTTFSFISLIIFCSLTALIQCRSLPSYIKPCKRHDPNLEQCTINLIEGLKPRLPKGLPEMRIPPLDPFVVPLVSLNQGSDAVRFNATFKNITAYNGHDFNMTKLKIDFDTPAISVDVFFPLIRMSSNYSINGKILIVPINGHGKSFGNFTKVSVSLYLKGKYVHKNNKTYMTIVGRNIHFKMGGMYFHFDGLFGGKNKALSDTTNQFINENWRDIIQELNPLLEETIGEVLMSVVKGFLDLYTLEDLFPLDKA